MKKNFLKRFLAIGCAATLAFSVTGCGEPASSTASSSDTAAETSTESAAEEAATELAEAVDYTPSTGKTSHTDGDGEQIKLAFVLYNWTDDQGLYLESYLDYLAENMNISVECVSYEDSAEDLINVIESLCSEGVDGIAVATDDGFQSWAQICEDNGVYCTIMLGCLSDDDDQEFAKGLNYYLGSCGNYDYNFLGEDYADFIVEQGYQNVLIAKPSRGLQDQADQMTDGCIAVLDEKGVKYNLLETSWGDMFSSVAAALTSDSYDAIYCPLSVMSFGLPNIYANNLVGQTVAMGHGTDESMSDVFGSLVTMFSDNLTTSAGANVAMLINAAEGNQYADYPAGECVNITAPVFVVNSEEAYATYGQYIRNYEDPVYYVSVDCVESFILSYNPDASFADVSDYISGLTIENAAENVR